MKDSWWLRAAILDDKVVAGLLLRLKDSPPPSTSTSTTLLNRLPPSWGLRQPRSKPPSTSSSLTLSFPEKRTETRRSPTGPLSWTGGSGAVDGDGDGEGEGEGEGGSPSEHSSELNLHQHQHQHRLPSDPFRSKISAVSDTPTTSSKRCRRKKTFAQLKEEESSLLKERSHLKRELETLGVTLKEQRSLSEKLKKIKLDLQVECGIKPEYNPHLGEQITTLNGTCEPASSSVSRHVKTEDASEHSCSAQKSASSQAPVFVLPDLNMAPDEECGVAWIP